MTYSQRLRARQWAEARQRVEARRPALLDLLAGDDETERARFDQRTTAELICLIHCPATLPGT